jgi:hypothetical protein
VQWEDVTKLTLWRLLQIVISGKSDRHAVARQVGNLRTVEPKDAEVAGRLTDSLGVLAENALVVVEAPISRRMRVKYSLRARLKEVTWSIARRHTRRRRYVIPLQGSTLTREYTAQFILPTHQYVASCALRDLDNGRWLTLDDLSKSKDTSVEIVSGRDFSQAVIHIQNRGGVEKVTLAADFEVREVPPGTLGRVVVLSAATTFLLIFMTLVQPDLLTHQSTGGAGATDLPALLVGLPAFMASWLGYSLSEAAQVSTSMATRFGYRIVVFQSCASVFLYIAQISGLLVCKLPAFTVFHGLFEVESLSVYWVTLAVISIATCLGLCRSLIIEFHAYSTMQDSW